MSKRKNNDVLSGGQSPDGSRAGGWTGPVGNVMKDEFGLDIPVENVPLPSAGVVYPPDHPLHMQETVQIRSMTAREEDILTSKALIKKGTVITELIRSCLIDKRIDPNDMILGDRNALMVSLRITGYGSDYPVEINCPSCGEKSKQRFNLAELPITRLTEDPIAKGSNIFEVTMPKTKENDPEVKVRYKHLTGQDETAIAKMQERKRKQGQAADNLVTQRYQHQIVAVNDISDKTKVQMFCQRMPTRYSLALRRAMDANEPGISMKQWITCPHCSEESEVSMPLGASFFWPDAKS
jgi:sarcosine oxidase delta subunit